MELKDICLMAAVEVLLAKLAVRRNAEKAELLVLLRSWKRNMTSAKALPCSCKKSKRGTDDASSDFRRTRLLYGPEAVLLSPE